MLFSRHSRGGFSRVAASRLEHHNQPLVRAIRAASTRFAAPRFLIASDKEFKNDRDQCKFVSWRRWQLSSRPGVQKILEIFSRSRGMPFDSLAKGREAQSRCNTFC